MPIATARADRCMPRRRCPRHNRQATADDSPRTSERHGCAKSDAPPLVIIPGQGSITLMSEDEAALVQAEALLRTLAQTESIGGGRGQLCRVFAAQRRCPECDETDDGPVRTDARHHASHHRTRQHGGRRAAECGHRARPRRPIARSSPNCLRVLDSSNVPDSLANARPLIVAVEYLEANRVLEILAGHLRSAAKIRRQPTGNRHSRRRVVGSRVTCCSRSTPPRPDPC